MGIPYYSSTYFLNVESIHSDHPVNLDKTMRGEKEDVLLCDVAEDAIVSKMNEGTYMRTKPP